MTSPRAIIRQDSIPDSQEYSAFITQYGLFEWTRVAMGLKGSGPFLQRSMANNVLAGYVTRICEIYIDDVLIHGSTDNEYIDNTRKVLTRLRTKKITANPEKARLVSKRWNTSDISFPAKEHLLHRPNARRYWTFHCPLMRRHSFTSSDS